MPGHIRKRSKGSWTVVIDIGRDPVTKKRRQHWETVRGKKKDAETALVRLLRERDTGVDIHPDRLTVGDYLRRWLRDYATRKVAPSTLERYHELVHHHLIPALGHLRLHDLRPTHIQAAYANLSRRDGKDGRLSAKSVAHIHALLREALRWAVQWQLISRNPSDAVATDRVNRSEMRVLDPTEVGRLLEAARGTPYYIVLYTALATGARSGELLALRWQDIDLEGGWMQILRTQRFSPGRD